MSRGGTHPPGPPQRTASARMECFAEPRLVHESTPTEIMFVHSNTSMALSVANVCSMCLRRVVTSLAGMRLVSSGRRSGMRGGMIPSWFAK